MKAAAVDLAVSEQVSYHPIAPGEVHIEKLVHPAAMSEPAHHRFREAT